MARKKAEIDTGKLLQALDARHEELLRDLEDLNLQIELALSQLRVADPKAEPMAPPPAQPVATTATKPAKAAPAGKSRRRSAPPIEVSGLIDSPQQPQT
jgi:hypothetical protein